MLDIAYKLIGKVSRFVVSGFEISLVLTLFLFSIMPESIILKRPQLWYTVTVSKEQSHSVVPIMIDILTGCIIEYLPPYSPDYHPIKLAFVVIKSHLRHCGLSFFTYKSHYYELYKACEEITLEDRKSTRLNSSHRP